MSSRKDILAKVVTNVTVTSLINMNMRKNMKKLREEIATMTMKETTDHGVEKIQVTTAVKDLMEDTVEMDIEIQDTRVRRRAQEKGL